MKQKKSSEEYITKDYFDNSITQLLKGIRNEIKFAAENIIEDVKITMQKYSDVNLTRFDGIIKELEEMREDRIIGDHQNEKLRKTVDGHEKRIKRLEQVRHAA